jgi:SOS response regulatory protein OraA/RecX
MYPSSRGGALRELHSKCSQKKAIAEEVKVLQKLETYKYINDQEYITLYITISSRASHRAATHQAETLKGITGSN